MIDIFPSGIFQHVHNKNFQNGNRNLATKTRDFFLIHYQNFTDCKKRIFNILWVHSNKMIIWRSLQEVCRSANPQNKWCHWFTHFHVSETLFSVDVNVVQKTFSMWKNREAFYVLPLWTAHVYVSWAFNVQNDLHVIQNAFINYPRIALKLARSTAFGEKRNILPWPFAKIITRQLRWLKVFCHHRHCLKTGYLCDSCVFILVECKNNFGIAEQNIY